MTAYFLASLWATSGLIPAIIYERWSVKRYGGEVCGASFTRFLLAALCGPIAGFAIAVIMGALERDEQDDDEDEN